MARWKNSDGASLVAAIVFFAFCGIGASIILTAASASSGRHGQFVRKEQKRMAAESAAAFLRDEIIRPENVVKILESEEEIRYYYVGEQGDPEDEDTWTEFALGADEGILDSLIRDCYEAGMEAEQEFRKDFTISVSSKQSEADVRLWMDADYQITAVAADKERTCRRRLTIPAQVVYQEEVEREDTSVMMTTIFWETGVIERGVSDAEWE